jgi:DNA-binding NarL/FixJ family response regulator
LKNEKEDVSPKNQEKKPKKKKRGKIAEVFRLHQKGVPVKEIAEKMKLWKATVQNCSNIFVFVFSAYSAYGHLKLSLLREG